MNIVQACKVGKRFKRVKAFDWLDPINNKVLFLSIEDLMADDYMIDEDSPDVEVIRTSVFSRLGFTKAAQDIVDDLIVRLRAR